MICRKSKKKHHRRPATEHDEQLLSIGVLPPCLACELEAPGEAGSKGMRPGVLLGNDQELDIGIFPILSTLRNLYGAGREVDLLLVIGTSLPQSLNNIIIQLKRLAINAIYVDQSPRATDVFDFALEMAPDELAELLGYSDLQLSRSIRSKD
ncbi:hypothetical protein TWF718_009677 [Orbilia javanica]|uniref:Uncharacterized protein n=1 Tax=Orbilia javanica TaxID=47235 RepID=A0AAN8MKK5_9PEZI